MKPSNSSKNNRLSSPDLNKTEDHFNRGVELILTGGKKKQTQPFHIIFEKIVCFLNREVTTFAGGTNWKQVANSGDILEFVIYENFVVADVLNGDGDQTVRGNFTVSGDSRVGIDTSAGVILKSPNGTSYRLYVENDGTLKTKSV